MKPSDAAATLPALTASTPSWFNRRGLAAIARHLPALSQGCLTLHLPGGRKVQCGEPTGDGPQAEIHLHSYRPLRRLLRGGLIGGAEGFMEGEWDCPDLTTLTRWALANEAGLRAFMGGNRLLRLLNRLAHLRRNNSKRGSRRNIAYHYDLGNDFYRLWLDPSMTYSAALFESERMSLLEAQQHKYRTIAQMLDLRPGQRILEVGCGWGGFAELAAREFGVQVEGITLSREQLTWAQQRVAMAGLDERCRFSLTDYRDVEGAYDHIVSIEMFEAVGESHWPSYFAMLRRCLKPGGEALLQIISIDDDRFEHYRRNPDFIQRYIFPGGMLPSPSALRRQLADSRFELKAQRLFGRDYGRTLAHWREAFLAHWPQIAGLGFDERFRRMWLYYLGYCEGGFQAGTIDVGLYHLRPLPVSLDGDLEGTAGVMREG